MAVRGDEPLKIQQRAGHSTFSTTQLYVRTAESVREGFGTPFHPFPVALGFRTVSDSDDTRELIEPETRRSRSGTRVSNSRPSAWEADALPTELVPRGEGNPIPFAEVARNAAVTEA